MKLGRHGELTNQREESQLEAGMDFRLPRYRREVFLRFYEFHLRYRAHPGCVYYLLPYIAEQTKLGIEERLWFAYINGNTQNPVTSSIIFREFPSFEKLDRTKLTRFFGEHYDRLAFDTDRRYFKKSFLDCVKNYKQLVDRAADGNQEQFFRAHSVAGDAEATFRNLWAMANRSYIYFGRLSVFSYLEYLRIAGVEVDCDQLFLDDLQGSKSHRNGLCKVLGRDDLDWHESNPSFDGKYSGQLLDWLKGEGSRLLYEARLRCVGQTYARDVGYFTLESALCTYKSWHRPNRRYPNVYNDMLVDRIRLAEKSWGKQDVFWAARRATLPEHLRLEDTPNDVGVKPEKQNHYRLTGQVIMMDRDWPCFRNDYNEKRRSAA